MKDEISVERKQPTVAMLVFGLMIFIRLALSSRLPSYILADMPHDDAWVVRHAAYILMQDWFGRYDQFTLIKGPFSPLLLAFSAGLGVTFGGLNAVLYCVGCFVFITSVRPIMKNHWVQIFCFTVLLFNPITYALETGQRVYRNGIGQWQILIIFGCFIAVFLRRNEDLKGLLKWAILGGLTLGAFFQTREDGAWIYPFILGAIACTTIAFMKDNRATKKNIIIFLLPVAIAWFINDAAAFANYQRYGAPIVNDRSGGNYSKVAADLYSITPDSKDEAIYKSDAYKAFYINIYASTMEKAFTVSPTLDSASPFIREAIRQWASWDDPKKIGELSTDHMLFALRDGLKSAGLYRTLPETEEFFGKVHHEIQTAFERGILIKRGYTISSLVQPIQKGDLENTFSLMPKAVRDIITFSDVSSGSFAARGSDFGIAAFHLLAGGDYYTSPGRLIGNGWAFAKDGSKRLTAGLYNKEGALIAKLPLELGEDVFQYMLTKGFDYQNARMSRFSFDIDGYNLKSGVKIRFLDLNGNLFREIPADGTSLLSEDGSFQFYIDSLKSTSPDQIYTHLVKRANRVINIYKNWTPFLSLISCLAYFVVTIMSLSDIRKRRPINTLPVWIILTGLALTFFLFMLSMCFITATTFNALVYIYTAPAFILLLMFCVVSVGWGLQSMLDSRMRRGL